MSCAPNRLPNQSLTFLFKIIEKVKYSDAIKVVSAPVRRLYRSQGISRNDVASKRSFLNTIYLYESWIGPKNSPDQIADPLKAGTNPRDEGTNLASAGTNPSNEETKHFMVRFHGLLYSILLDTKFFLMKLVSSRT